MPERGQRRRGRGMWLGPEHHEQVKVINWARHTARETRDPVKREALLWLHAIPSGGGRGKRFINRKGQSMPPLETLKLKAEGVTAGINDLRLDYVRRDADGFIIQPGLIGEMKAGKNDLTDKQDAYQQFMIGQGFAVFTWWRWWVAALDIAEYMALETFLPVMTEDAGNRGRIIRSLAQLQQYRLEV